MKRNKSKKVVIPAVVSIYDLSNKARTDERYNKLAMLAASNLGGSPRNLDDAIQWLRTNAQETDEQGVVGEINFCRDLVK